ncbi:MAG TPA: hypothetical protein DCQ92_15560 [Verrucomicrobia subdivision 3 bacterium]|nr:hypothetical protein [Limisphaerales bacterium]
MSAQIAGATFVPGTDTVSANGTFNGYGPLNLVRVGATTVYTNTANDTTDANGGQVQYKFVIDSSTWETTGDYHNRTALLPSTSGASLVLPTAFFADAGTPVANDVRFQMDVSQQIALGNFVNDGSSYVDVRGSFNSWSGGASVLTNDPTILRTNQFGLVTSNVWVGTFSVNASPGAAIDFKYVIQPATIWEAVSPVNSDDGGNRFFANVAQTLPLVDFADAPFAPLCSVTFAVDMSAQAYYGNWNPAMAVDLAGSLNGWNTGATPMTNNPTASNTNIYYAVVVIGQGSTPQYKFTYQGAGGTVWESVNPPTPSIGGNRFFMVPSLASTTLPTVFFSGTSIYDLLTTNVWVTFTVSMTNASQYPSGPAFNFGSDNVYVNGPAFTGAWLGWDPISLASYQLTNNPIGSEVYSGQFLIPLGSALKTTYKYSINGVDNEAGSGNDRGRYIRSTVTGAYSFPMDTFGSQYNEPSFGQLAVGKMSAGTVPLSWLGAPNVQVQTCTNLTSGSWVSHPETSGAVWSAGINSTNGLVSVTNWPAGSGKLFFRLMQQ